MVLFVHCIYLRLQVFRFFGQLLHNLCILYLLLMVGFLSEIDFNVLLRDVDPEQFHLLLPLQLGLIDASGSVFGRD